MVIHAALLVAVHAQPVAVATATLPVAPDRATCGVGAGRTPPRRTGWVTLNVWPPIVSVPVRARVPVFAATGI